MWERWRWHALVPCLLVMMGIGTYVTSKYQSSIQERLAIWEDTAEGLTIPGRGAGSFFMLYPEFARRTDTMHTRPEDPHNEFLNLAFEYGVGALPLLTLLALSFTAAGAERYVVVAFLAIAFFSFPSRIPTEGFVGMVALGRLCRRGNIPWPKFLAWRPICSVRQACFSRRALSLEPIRAYEGGI